MRYLLCFLAAATAAAQPWLRTVCASGCDYDNLQVAINAARDYQNTTCKPAVVELRAGETFTGNFELPAKACAQYVYIRSSRLGELPGGQRVSPAQAGSMARLEAPANSIFATVKTADASGTGYWALQGLEIASPSTNSQFQYTLVGLSESYAGERQPQLTPHHVLVDRCYIHGWDGLDGPLRCVGAHGRNLVIRDNYIANCKYTGGDSQGIWMQNGPGPIDIVNNFIEGAAENIMVGGAAPASIPWVAVRNIRVIGNHLYKRRAWKYGSGTSAPTWPCVDGEQYRRTSPAQSYVCSGGSWVTAANSVNYWVKNLFELKEGQNVQLYGNLLDGNWWDKQTGTNVLINQTNARHYNVRNFHMAGNWIRTGQAAFGTGYFGTTSAVFTSDIVIEHNLWTELGSSLYGMNGNVGPQTFVLQTNYRNRNYRFTHNTVVPPVTGTYYIKNLTKATEIAGGFDEGFTFRDNVVVPGQYLFNRDGYPSNGWCSWIAVMATPSRLDLRKNLVLESAGNYSHNSAPGCPSYADFPSNHVFEPLLATVFEDPAGGNWRMKSTYLAGRNGATDGTDLGADIDRIQWGTANAVSGAYSAYLHSGIRGVRPAATGATVEFTAPSAQSCAVAVSTGPSFAVLSGSNSQVRAGLSGTAVLSGLSAATEYWVRLTCGIYRYEREFRTSAP